MSCMEYDIVRGVEDDFSLSCPHALWTERLSPRQIEAALVAGRLSDRPRRRDPGTRAQPYRPDLRIGVQHTKGTLVLEGGGSGKRSETR